MGSSHASETAVADGPQRAIATGAPERMLADRRKVPRRGTLTATVLMCPNCGADRVIPMTFPMYQREAGPKVVLHRPMAKCADCGQRIFAKIITRRRTPKSAHPS